MAHTLAKMKENRALTRETVLQRQPGAMTEGKGSVTLLLKSSKQTHLTAAVKG